VRIGKLPQASDDLDYEVATSELLTGISVLDNDIYEEDDYLLELIEPFLPGLTDLGSGIFDFQANGKNTVHNFFYRICSRTCPDLCDDAVVAITARERVCEFIPNTITPNGDGINDYLIIPCLDIESYPQNNLVIYNQWGDKVYEASPYNNAADRAWQGELRGESGKPLPDATYYYLFRPSPQHTILKGFIEILR
jgi:gliding motility-associated-like protein